MSLDNNNPLYLKREGPFFVRLYHVGKLVVLLFTDGAPAIFKNNSYKCLNDICYLAYKYNDFDVIILGGNYMSKHVSNE